VTLAGNLERRWSVIKKVKGGYKVLSEKGKNLGGPYKTKGETVPGELLFLPRFLRILRPATIL
jgi:hypothetical protein